MAFLSGFLWFAMETPQSVTPALFNVLGAPNVTVTTNVNGAISVECPEDNGRTVTIETADDGVLLTVRDANDALEHTWTITNPDGSVSLVKRDQADNPVSDETYAYSALYGEWVRTDNLGGAEETLDLSGDLETEGQQCETRSLSAGGVKASGTVSYSSVIGSGASAAARVTQTYTYAWNGYCNDWLGSSSVYWTDHQDAKRNGLLRLRHGETAAWEYHDYDARGRETLAAGPLDGSAHHQDMETGVGIGTVAELAALQGMECAATEFGYAVDAEAGDTGDAEDSRKPRSAVSYVVRNGGASAVSREWRVYTRGATNEVPTLAVRTVRAASASAAYGDAANAVSLAVSYAGPEKAGVPTALWNLPLREEREDGSVTSWAYEFGGYDPSIGTFTPGAGTDYLRATSRTGTVQQPDGADGLSEYAVEIRDSAFGRTLKRDIRLRAAGAGDPVLSWEKTSYDVKGHMLVTAYSDGTFETNVWDCCRLQANIGRDGRRTEYWSVPGIPGWKATAETSLGALPGPLGRYPVTEIFTDALGRETNRVRSVWFSGTRDSGYMPVFTETAFPHGTADFRIATDAFHVDSLSTDMYGGNCRIGETVSAGVTNRTVSYWGGATVEEKYWGGKWTRETRSASYNGNGCRVETAVKESSDYPAVTASVTVRDFLGRVASVTTPLGVTSNFYGGASDRVVRVSLTGQPDTLYAYDELGNLTATALDADGDGQVSHAGTDRISATGTRYEEDASNVWWRVTAQTESVGGVTNSAAVVKERLTGLSPALQSCVVTINAEGAATTETVSFDPSTHVTTVTDVNSLRAAPSVRLSKYGCSLETRISDGRSENAYDGFARVATQTESTPEGFTNFVLTVDYDALGLAVTNRVVYGPDAAVSATAYDALGRASEKTDALGNTVVTEYDALGQAVSQSGAVYPVGYGYDTAGRRTSVRTFRDESGAGDETRRNYDGATGLLTNKVYSDGSSVRYGYTPGGRLLSRRWARGVTMTNNYDNLGQIVRIDYSGSMFDVFHTYDAFGHALASSNSFARYEYRNSLSGTATNELVTVGTNTCALTRSLDVNNRPAGLTVDGSEAVYGYDEENRLSSVSRPEAEAEYRYTNGFVAGYTLTLTNGNAIERFVGRDPYRQELALAVSNFFNGAFMQGTGYGHDLLGRRERRIDTAAGLPVTNAFAYNLRSEVTNAVFGADLYAYGYDAIGNRVFHAANAVTNTYSANNLNQYIGFCYDADGNLLSDGRLYQTWDPENRLVRSEPAGMATNGAGRLVNSYDHRHRRVQKCVEVLTGRGAGYPMDPSQPGSWDAVKTHTFVYDGWNLVLETVAHTNGSVDRIEYVWGLDVSGTLQGAVGVGGLLFEKRNGQIYIPLYDANGNVTAYVDANGTFWARYVYDAFGNTTHQSGDMANTFRFRFSTKYHDMETGYYYYIGRFYHPELGRWLNRDPVEERGGLNLYGFAENDPVNKIDRLGLFSVFPVASSPRDKADKDGSLEWLWASVFIFFSNDEKTALKQHGGGYVLHEKHTEIHIKKCNGNVVNNETQTVQKRIPVTATGLTRAYAATTENSIAPVYANVANMSGYGKCVQGTISVKAGWYLITGNKLPPGGGPLKDELSGSLDAEQQHGNINATEGWPSMAIGKFLSFGSLSIEVHLSCSDPYSIHASGRNIARGSLINRIDQYGESRATEGTGYVW